MKITIEIKPENAVINEKAPDQCKQFSSCLVSYESEFFLTFFYLLSEDYIQVQVCEQIHI